MLVGATRAATVLERTCDASSVRAVDVIEEVGTRSEELIAAMITIDTSAAERHADA